MLIKKTLLPMVAIPLAVSGVLHLLAPFVGGFVNQNMVLLLVGLLYIGAAYLFRKASYGGYRWLAWIMFFVLLIATLLSFGNYFVADGIMSWLFLGIVIANVIALILLFGALWRSKT